VRVESIRQLFKAEVKRIEWKGEELGLLAFGEGKGQLLFTTNFANYPMPVPEKYAEFARIELYFLLPNYWKTEVEDVLFQWAMETLIGIKNYLLQNRWAISGHTFSLQNLPESRFKESGFEALMLADPLSLEALKNPIDSNNGALYFKALIPIFKREKELKVARGIQYLIGKFADKGVNEMVDEFRISTVKSRFLFWR